MRLATWNVNSIRARSEQVVAWMNRHAIDVLAMQETKCTDDQFPVMSFLAHGYDVAFHGSSGYNGVAIASRIGVHDIHIGFDGQPLYAGEREARAISATCGGVRVWSLYAPNGREPGHDHFQYKLDWLSALADVTSLELSHDPAAQVALAGDWNVAPTDEDVWDPEYFASRTHTSDEERAAFRRFVEGGFVDSAAPFTPGPGTYTFWDYQAGRFARNEGMRIDFALCSPALDDRIHDAFIDRDARAAEGASDHAPLVFDLS
ncbi:MULTISPECIES: exodeoxyribonuclease III [Gordonia]|uniref:Exodeoxyribonuclease III n=1 Tax=Gordonia cholesterolivorans TaxID=559625 RepID=A0ABP5URZ2_9ACTN|nr:exodeoxyribonuclease III [Gordonia sihwensis]KJR03246.1 exodeoxyribonuclease III [Gordonia sihwensis]MBY4570846.1 exodeoxyribonuclease III [Gordonia sihwensis]